MPTGSCLCGQLKISYDAEPEVLCHCRDCQKMSGSTYSTNVILKPDTFKSTGIPKIFTKTADSGAKINSYFCGECGTTVWNDSPTFGDMKVVKAGVLDGKALDTSAKPEAEFYASVRVPWLSEFPGAAQKARMS